MGSPNVWYSNASEWEQEVITGAAQPDPVKAYIKVQTEQPGAIALKKTSEDGVIAGVKFKISGNGVERTVVTGSDGSVKASDLPPGTYTVSEVEIPGYYETPESQTVKLTAGETASVSFSNTLKKGDLVVTKTAEDGLKQGFTFKLTGTSDSGEKINLTAVTGTDGKATFQNVPIGSGYVLSEVNTPDYYIVPDNQTAAIEWNKVTNKSFYNELKKGRLTITKTAEDGFKEGFTFKLAGRADNGKWVKFIASTDENGKVTFEDIPIGSNYQVYEIHTPGYYVVPDTQDVVIEWNKVVNCSFTNDLKKGSLTVTKTAEDGLKEGFTFRLTGTADNGQSVNLTATTDSTGKATFKNVPIGSNYILSEINTPDYYVVPANQTAEIEWNKVTSKSFTNNLKKGSLTVTKTAEDGLKEGFTFRLTGTSDSGKKVDLTAKTNSSGKATFTNVPIGSGYVLSEINTPGHYVVPADQKVDIEWNKVISASVTNSLKKGSLTVTKTAEDGLKQGFTFRLTGTSDSGQKIDLTAVTGEDGRAVFQNVPIGSNYVLSEVNTPDYYIVPANQTAAIEWNEVTNKSFTNNLKKGSLTVTKTAEYGLTEGLTFRLTGTSDSGEKVNLTAKTNSSGKATFTDVPIGSGYVLSEINTPDYYIVPDNQTADIEWNEVTNKSFTNNLKKGSLTVTKTAEYGLTEGLTFRLTGTSDSGKKVDLTAKTNSSGKATFTNVPIGSGYVLSEINTPDYYIVPDNQTADIEWNEVTNKSFTNNLKKGSLTVTKTSEDGLKEGFTFRLTGTSDSGKKVNLTAKTDKNGKATFTDVPIGSGYVLSEVGTKDWYIVPDDQKAAIEWNKVTNKSFYNALKKGDLTVTKTAEDGLKEGLTFCLTGTADNGSTINLTAVTGPDGRATFENVPIGSGYVLSEVGTPDRYVIPDDQEGDIEWDKVTHKSVSNILKKFRVELHKSDAETGTAQGDAVLDGAEYTLYNQAGEKLETLTIKNGTAISKYYPCQTITIRETKAPVGYQLDDTVYTVEAPPDGQTVEHITLTREMKDDVIKGKVAILKFLEEADDDGNIKPPLEGIEFTVTLNSDPSVKDVITTDENGYAETRFLPYGVYTITETKPPESAAPIRPFTVNISENQKVYHYILSNDEKGSLVKIVKADAGTGKIIPLAGVGFKIKDLSTGEWVTQHINYPVPTDIDEFFTSNDGTLMLPTELPYGDYELYETAPPIGYLLHDEPIPFTIDGTQEVVTVTCHNTAVKGEIQVEKIGERFTTVKQEKTEYGTQYTPVFTKSGLPDVEFTVTAAEQVSAIDGTVLLEKGQVAGVITTGSNGKADLSGLPLGADGTARYLITETGAPDDHLTAEPVEVTLSYKDDQTPVVTASAKIEDTRKKVQVTLKKQLEKDELFQIGSREEYQDVVFGLFAEKDILSADGSQKIPAGSLIAYTGIDTEGKADIPADLPAGKYYVQELATNDQYVLDGKKYPVVVDYSSQDVETVTIDAGNGSAVQNTLKRGSISGWKIDQDGFELGGAKIGLFPFTVTEFTEDSALMVTTSNPIGYFTFREVPYGNYLIREIESPEGFLLTEDVFPVQITENGEEIKLHIQNQVIQGSVEVHKTNSEDTRQLLTGAVFGIYVDVNRNGIFEKEIDKRVDQLTETETGIYRMDDLAYGSYFVHEEQAPEESFIRDDGYYPFAITEDGKTVLVEKKPGEGFTNELKKGSLTVTKTSEDGLKEGFIFRLTGTADSGEKIDLTAVTDKDGKAVFQNVPIGSGYVLSEENTPDRYVVPEDQTADIEWNKVTNKSFTNILKKFRVQLHKSDAETGTAQGDAVLDGAQYTLYNQQGKELETLTITDGTAVSGYYPCQTITIRETKAPVGYQLDDTVYTIEAPADEQTEEHITLIREVKEQVNKGKIAIRKYLAQAGSEEKLPMEGIKFTVTLNSDPNIKEVITTNAEGYAETGLLPYGVYTVTETGYPESVTPIKPFTVTISEHQKTYEFVLDNIEKSAQLKIVKADEDTGKTIPMEGAGFRIKDLTSGKWVSQNGMDEFFTTKDGTLMLPKVLPYGSYELYETVPPVGYLLYDKPIPFTIDGSQQVVTVTCHDTAVKGDIQVEKIGERFTAVKQEETPYGTQYTPVFTKTGLPDVEFTVTAAENICAADGTVLLKKGQTAGVIITGKDGKATLPNLPLGADGTARYLITETGAPDDHLTAKPEEVTLSYQDGHTPVVTVSANVVDTRKKVQITLQKELEQDEKFGIGTGEESRNVVFGLFAEKDIFSADGSRKISAGNLIAYTGIDENGNATFPTDVPAGAYYVQELATDDPYILDGRKYPVVFTYEGQDTETVTIDAGNGNVLKNTLKRGKISGWKVDQDGFELGGAVIGLFRENAGEFTEENALMVTESNEIGYFEFVSVPYGRYIVKEIQSPTGFLLSADTFPIEIKEDGQVIKITIENQIIRGSVEVRKLNSEDPSQLLSGAAFSVYVDVDHNGRFDSTIDKLVGNLTEIEKGLYQMKDLVYGSYFLHEEESPQGFVRDDGYYPFSITEDGETITLETKPGEGFVNRPVWGELELSKKDISTGKPLPNTGIEILDKDGNVIFQGRTDENGVVKFKLPYGEYFYREFDAPEGYQLDETAYPFSITEDGEIVQAVMTNERIPEAPPTGDVRRHAVAVLLTATSGASLLLPTIKRKRKKKNRT